MDRRNVPGLAALAAVLAAVLIALIPASAHAQTGHNWIENAWTTHVLDQSYPASAGYFYNRPGSYGTGSSYTSPGIYDGFATTPVLRYTSYAQFASDLAGGVIPSATWPAGSWVEYDNEEWAGTPTAEQQDPEQYMQDFGTAAHNAGFKVFMTPARDLGNVDTTCPKQAGWDNNTWYEQCHIAKWAVTDGDGLVVQDQASTLSPATYQALFDDAQADAAAANPDAWVDSELSGSYGTPAQAYTAGSKLSRSRCAGFFIHVASSDVAWENTLLSSFKSGGW